MKKKVVIMIFVLIASSFLTACTKEGTVIVNFLKTELNEKINEAIEILNEKVEAIGSLNEQEEAIGSLNEQEEAIELPDISGMDIPIYTISFINEDEPLIPYYCTSEEPDVWKEAPRSGSLYYDPIEDTEVYLTIIPAINKLVEQELGDFLGTMGSCHVAWATQKRLLKELYNIEWHSYSDMNPGICFD